MEQTKKHFLKNLAGFSTLAWVSAALGLLSTVIGTRLFEPPEKSKIDLFFTYSSVFASLCYLGLDQAFVRFFREPPGRSTRAGLLAFCAVTSLGFSVFSSLLLLIGWREFSGQVMGQADFTVFLCLAVFSFFTVLFRYLSLCYRMEQNAKLYTLQGVIHVVLTKIAYLSVGIGSAQGKDAILLLTLMMGAFTLVFAWVQRKRFDMGFAAQADKPFLKEVGLYAAPLIPLALTTELNKAVSTVTLQLMSDQEVSIYTSALSFQVAINAIGAGFNAYWAPYVYENYQSDNKRHFFTVHKLMACVLTLVGLGITLMQTPIFWLFGEKYRGSAIYFPFVMLVPICYCLSETTGMGIHIAKKTHWNTLLFFASLLLNLGLCFVLIPGLGPTGAALASAAAAILSLTLRTWAGERYYKAILNYRYAACAVGLLLAASFGNLLLAEEPLLKYAVLVGIFGLACLFFRKEMGILWKTVWQVVKEGKSALGRRKEAGSTDE